MCTWAHDKILSLCNPKYQILPFAAVVLIPREFRKVSLTDDFQLQGINSETRSLHCSWANALKIEILKLHGSILKFTIDFTQNIDAPGWIAAWRQNSFFLGFPVCDANYKICFSFQRGKSWEGTNHTEYEEKARFFENVVRVQKGDAQELTVRNDIWHGRGSLVVYPTLSNVQENKVEAPV